MIVNQCGIDDDMVDENEIQLKNAKILPKSNVRFQDDVTST